MAKSSDLHLPGSFSSYPKGPKPKHYAPHGQRSVDPTMAMVGHMATLIANAWIPRSLDLLRDPQGPPAQRTLELKRTPQGPPAQRTLELKKTPQGPPKSQRTIESNDIEDADPYGSYYFALEIGTSEVAHFMECSGLKNACQPYEIQEGGLNGGIHRRPGQSKWENIVLKYATSASTYLLEWRDGFLQDGFGERRDGAIIMMDNAGNVVRKFTIKNAWPVAWEGPAFNAGGSDLAIETLEIAHDGLVLEGGGSAYSSSGAI